MDFFTFHFYFFFLIFTCPFNLFLSLFLVSFCLFLWFLFFFTFLRVFSFWCFFIGLDFFIIKIFHFVFLSFKISFRVFEGFFRGLFGCTMASYLNHASLNLGDSDNCLSNNDEKTFKKIYMQH